MKYYRFNGYELIMKGRCMACGREFVDMPPDARYCSIECTYGLPIFKNDAVVYP